MTRSRPYRRIRSWLIWQSGDDPAWILAAQIVMWLLAGSAVLAWTR